MGDHYLAIMPRDPRYSPSDQQLAAAREVVADFFSESEVRTASAQEFRFVHTVEGFESPACPNCGASLDFDWWSNQMNHCAAVGFEPFAVVSPCCSTECSLADLDYHDQAAFAHCVIEVHEPRRLELGPRELLVVARELGRPLRQVWVHV